jgi:hypothetical protein
MNRLLGQHNKTISEAFKGPRLYSSFNASFLTIFWLNQEQQAEQSCKYTQRINQNKGSAAFSLLLKVKVF